MPDDCKGHCSEVGHLEHHLPRTPVSMTDTGHAAFVLFQHLEDGGGILAGGGIPRLQGPPRPS